MHVIAGAIKKPNWRWLMPRFFLILAAAAMLSMLVPNIAFAWFFDGVNAIDDWIKNNLIKPAVEGMLDGYVQFIGNITMGNILTASFEDIFGNSGGTSLYSVVNTIHQTVVVPLGHSILALVMLVQVVKISQRMDANATLPAVKDILFLMVFYVIFLWLINNSADLCVAVYNVINDIIIQIGNPASLGIHIELGDVSGTSMGTLTAMLIITVLSFIVAFVAWVVCFVMTYFRALQLYLYTTFSPIPFALMGFDETRQFGVNFCRNFIAVCLAGAVMAFALVAYPAIIGGIVTGTGTIMWANGLYEGTVVVQMLAVSVVLIFVMVKSGSIARDILGG